MFIDVIVYYQSAFRDKFLDFIVKTFMADVMILFTDKFVHVQVHVESLEGFTLNVKLIEIFDSNSPLGDHAIKLENYVKKIKLCSWPLSKCFLKWYSMCVEVQDWELLQFDVIL